ncbi:ABC transporter permease [Leadbettera azotonutricia]|uniref:Ribose transport system permease protein RbsC n=1 Tax=Leadbettera azotonutricia (strain ATCC BAA-888 / DSM 13862 / ZAS-9) TaxID=545695 RepID=F5YA46_LEAAZ|nr:ABC transporter permease [Leadbettera azotonutricia]AEF81393.1 ribose transport system permease protein RbsC [Leadbettera azotonutricia ZAS-9]
MGIKLNGIQRAFRARGVGQVIVVSGFLIVLLAIFQMLNNNFLGPRNIQNLLRQIAPFIIVGIAQSYVLITGNIDLSIGSVLGMSCMISATLMTHNVPPVFAAGIALIACMVVGVANGFLVAQFKLPPFIATLGTMTIARGIAQISNGSRNTRAIDSSENYKLISPEAAESLRSQIEAFKNFFYYHKFGFLFSTIIIALVIWFIFNFILTSTKIGRHMYAVGSNIEAAKMSGISVLKVTMVAYVVSALCAGVVGLIQTAQSGTGDMSAGNTYELYAVAASVIGGVSTLGGQGILLGTIVGAAIWSTLSNGLSLANVPIAIQNITVGIIVVISVLSDVIIRQRKK